MDRKILQLTIPNIISNITIPLLGMTDLAIAGHLLHPDYIGAIAIGTALFNLIYWNFGFLRMGTSGLTAQAYGAKNIQECMAVLIRAIGVALSIAFLLLLLQYFIGHTAIKLMDGSDKIKNLALNYFFVRIWAAPATLSMYAFKGWFIGMQNAKIPMFIAISMNIINILFSLLFVYVWHMDIEGIAWGTVIAQYSGVILSIIILRKYFKTYIPFIQIKKSLQPKLMRVFFHVNTDIFLRTLCLVAVFTFFTAASSAMGETTLAVNTLLQQLFILFSYIMDGFAYAGEALVGRFIGAKDGPQLRLCIKRLFVWGSGTGAVFTLIYAFFLPSLLSLFTNDPDIFATAHSFRFWITAVPLAGFMAFLFDGILVGATQSGIMRNSMFIATVTFFSIYYGFKPVIENNALWLAFIVYLFLRGILQWAFSINKFKYL